LGEESQTLEPAVATVRVGLVIEVPVKTAAQTDSDFLTEIQANKDISEAISQLIFAAINYRESDSSRSEHKVLYSKLVIFFDESTMQPVNITWRELT
jgi:hypothetical protein